MKLEELISEKLRRKLRDAINELPLDVLRKKMANEGIDQMDDKTLIEVIVSLRAALTEIPDALDRLKKALDEYEKRPDAKK